MEDHEKIEDKDLLNLLKALQKDKTLVKMNLPGRDFERITIITRVRHRRQNPFFLIDYTQGFREAVGDVKDVKMHFEFTTDLPYENNGFAVFNYLISKSFYALRRVSS